MDESHMRDEWIQGEEWLIMDNELIKNINWNMADK